MALPACCAASADDLPPRTLIKAPALRPVPDWVKLNLRPAHLPPPDWAMIEAHLKAGVTSLSVNMDSRWSKVGPSASLYKPEVVKEADETMRRYVEMVHRAGARAIFYIGPVHVPYWNAEFRDAHPDWLLVEPNGKPVPLGSWRTPYADWLAEQLAYVVRTYKVDGFWFDGLGGNQFSWDETSKRLFREASGGKEIPTTRDPRDPAFAEYLAWYWQGYVDLGDRLRGVIRKENPDAVIFANYSASRQWYETNYTLVEYPACYANAVDLPSVEQYWDYPGDALNQQFVAAFTAGVTHDRGAAEWIQPSAFGTAGVSPPTEFRLRFLLCATWGVYAEFVEPTGRQEYLTTWIADMKSRQEWMERSEPLPWIGLVASEQTKMLYGGTASLTRYFSHTLGAFRALFESHRPVRILTEYDLEDDNLQGVKVLVLPNVACLSDRAAEVIRRFVNCGGGLVATFETSLYDHTGAQRLDFALKDLFHADYAATHTVLTREAAVPLYIASKHAITDDPAITGSAYTSWIRPDDPGYGRLMMVAGAVEARVAKGAETLVNFRESIAAKETWPAAVVSQVGKGRVVYFPAALDQAMYFYPAGYLRRMLRNACDWAAGAPPPVEVDAPMILATTFRVQHEKHRTIVHLLNDASSWGRHSIYQKVTPEELKQWPGGRESDLRGAWAVREEAVPIHDIKVVCRIPGVKKATLQPENLALPLRKVAGGVEVTVPKVTLHSMVVFE